VVVDKKKKYSSKLGVVCSKNTWTRSTRSGWEAKEYSCWVNSDLE